MVQFVDKFINEKEIQNIFKKMGIQDFHNRGIKGSGIKYLELEGENGTHGRTVVSVAHKIAPNMEIFLKSGSVRVSRGKIDYDKSTIDDVIDWAIDNKVNIIGASIIGSNQPDLLAHFQRFIDFGGILLTSSGNDNEDLTTEKRFSNSEQFISVGAVNFNNDFSKIRKKSYSNYGDKLDFVTPVITIAEGTSFSQPFLAGMVGLILELKKMNQASLYQILKELSYDIGDKGFDDYMGWGLPILDYDAINNFSNRIVLTIGDNTIDAFGTEKVIDAEPIIHKGRTMIPLRHVLTPICDYLNVDIDFSWEDKNGNKNTGYPHIINIDINK